MYRAIIFLFILSSSCFTNEQSESKAGVIINKKDTITFDYKEKINELTLKLSGDFYITGKSCFVVASNLSEGETNELIENTILKAEECFYNDYFEIKPDEIITIFLFKNEKTYSYWAKKLYGDTDLSRFGYFKPSVKTMLMNISTGSGTLVHELTHSFVRYDFPEIPSWFNEGLGSLYERCSLNNKEIRGYTNWRLPDLQDAINDNSYTSLDVLIKTTDDEFYGNNSGINYAQARYLCQYLQDNNLLKSFYKTFRNNFFEDNTGKTFLEKITKSNIDELDIVYKKYVLGLKYSR